ncbi:hypothetical protein SSS_02720 [Sarcoptes scabiei]|uniref:Uncharacterized protein n=1 Tax=Sarcoptes scabiei TaxID=52283 RepID=A0A834RGL8_SARSC|nr:hypothetical protein SSS_02720 [Sarcoptes scabiei]
MACDMNFLSVIKYRGFTEIEIWMMRWYKKKKRKIPVPKSIAHHSNSPRSELLLPPNLRLVIVLCFPYRSVTFNAFNAFHHPHRFVSSHRILNLFQISIAFLLPDLFFVCVFLSYRSVTFNAFNAFHHRYQLVTLLHQIWNLLQILIAFIFLPDVNIVVNPGSNPEIVGTIKQREDDESHLMISLPDVFGAVVGRNLRDGRRTQSRVQEIIEKFLLKTATGILMIELHHLGGGLPDPDGTLQQAGSRIDTEKAMSHQHRLFYRCAEIYLSRTFEKLLHQLEIGGEALSNRTGDKGRCISQNVWYECAVSLPNWKDGDDVSIPNWEYWSKAESLSICGAVSPPNWDYCGVSPSII